MKKILSLSLLALSFFVSQAQNTIPFCQTEELHNKTYLENEEYRNKFDKTRALLEANNIRNFKTVVTGSGTEYHVPCIVHVIHTGGAIGSLYNPTDAAITAFINHINDGWANLNDNASISGTYNSVNIPIRFYLAQRDELNACSATTGINRIDNSSNATYLASGVGSPGITDVSLKSIVHWNDLDYYNIYIVNKIDGVDGNCSGCTFTAGYAYYPVLGGFKQDGMVVLAKEVTLTNAVFIHEMGHAFSLPHPFGSVTATGICPANTGNCAVDNDKICDTDPIQLDFTCNPTGANPCGGNFATQTTQFNYMAYNGCTDRFTAGQATNVNNALMNVRTAYKNTAGVDAPPSSLPTMITAPTFNATNANNNAGMGPLYVSLNSIEYTSGSYSSEGAGYVYYVDHTCNQATTLIKGGSYPISVKTDVNQQKVKVYIDYDNNGTFGTTAPEMVLSSTASTNTFTHSGTVIVPTSGVVFNTPLRMRVVADFSGSTITPTMQLQYGQAEDYTVTIVQAALPVLWRSFSAKMIENNQTQLAWATEMEKNNDYFEVEKSTDGIVFNTIAKVISDGDHATPTFYSSLDKTPSSGINYYRIKQTDRDAKISYSEVKSVFNNTSAFTLSAYPNPIADELNITLECTSNGLVHLELCDLNGEIVYQVNKVTSKGLNTMHVNTALFKQGIYVLKAVNKNEIKYIKVLKQ